MGYLVLGMWPRHLLVQITISNSGYLPPLSERGNGCENGGTPIFTPRGVFRNVEREPKLFQNPCPHEHTPDY